MSSSWQFQGIKIKSYVRFLSSNEKHFCEDIGGEKTNGYLGEQTLLPNHCEGCWESYSFFILEIFKLERTCLLFIKSNGEAGITVAIIILTMHCI